MRAPPLGLLLAASLLVLTPAALAAGGFIATLTAAQQSAAGLPRLSAAEQSALNTLVAREVSLARPGNVKAFAGTFTSRRRPEERAATGLDRLSAAELEQLDQLVANAIAAGPVLPTPPQRLKPQDVARKDRLEIHGEVTLAYGWGSGGREMRAGSLYTTIHDRDTGTTVALGLSQASGDGWWGYPWDYYDYTTLAAPLRPGFGAGFRPTTCRRR